MRLKQKFDELRAKGEKALITFITAGDPDLETTEKLVLEMERRGADIIELGLPFSDPLADGPVIQKASQRALEGGTRTPQVIELISRLRKRTEIPLVILTYYNLVFSCGQETFVKGSALAGVDGLIVPDLPLEESHELRKTAQSEGIDLIYLLAPTSTDERIIKTADMAAGFIYCVSLTGVTGIRKEFSYSVQNLINRIRNYTSLPLAIGFGISNPEQAAAAASYADGVIVGSALVRIVEEHGNNPDLLISKVGEYVSSLKEGILGHFSDFRL